MENIYIYLKAFTYCIISNFKGEIVRLLCGSCHIFKKKNYSGVLIVKSSIEIVWSNFKRVLNSKLCVCIL